MRDFLRTVLHVIVIKLNLPSSMSPATIMDYTVGIWSMFTERARTVSHSLLTNMEYDSKILRLFVHYGSQP
jgi:hypothetical protein